jgi:hypothetical protein
MRGMTLPSHRSPHCQVDTGESRVGSIWDWIRVDMHGAVNKGPLDRLHATIADGEHKASETGEAPE